MMRSNTLTKLAGLFVAALIMTWASRASAQVNVSGTIKGSLVSSLTPCTDDYAARCVVGPCLTFTAVPSPKITGNLGVGTATAMCITEDPAGNVNEGSTNHSCDPFFGALTSSTTRKGVATVTEVDIAGVVCHHQKTSTTDTIEGGFGIEGQDTDPAATGWGTLTGTVAKGGPPSAFSLKFKGSLTP
jgi:hypothetical protein